MDKLKITTLTPSKKKKQEINFKSKVKKLVVNKKISKNDEFFIQRAHKVPDVKVLSDITKLLLQTVKDQDSPDGGKEAKGEVKRHAAPDSEGNKAGCSILKGERVKNGDLQKEEKQNPEVSKTQHPPGGKTEPSTVAMTGGAASDADGRKCLKIDEAFSDLGKICGSEIGAVDLTKNEKRRKKRKRKGSNADVASGGEGMLDASLDPSSCLPGSSQDKSERHGEDPFSEGRDAGSLLSDVGKGGTKGVGSNNKKRRSGGRKSGAGILQGFQISELSPEKSEGHGGETPGGRRDSGFQVSELPADLFERHGKEARGGRRDSGFRVSEMTSEKSEVHEKEAFREGRESGNRSSEGGGEEQRKGAGNALQRESSQSAQISDSTQGKPERHGKEVFVGSQDTCALSSSTGSNKKKRKSDRTKSEKGIQKGFQVSDFSPVKSQGLRDTSISEDVEAGKMWKTSEGSGSDDLGKLAMGSKVDKPKQKDSRKTHRNSDTKVKNNESEVEVLLTLEGSQISSSIRVESEALDFSEGMDVWQNQQQQERSLTKKDVRKSKEPAEEGHDSTGKTQSTTKEERRILLHKDTVTLVSNRNAAKVSKKGKSCDASGGGNKLELEMEQREDVRISDSDEDGGTAFSSENDSPRARNGPPPILSLEGGGAPSAMSGKLQLAEEEEAPEQSYVNLEGFVQFKRSKPSEGADTCDPSNLQFYRLADSRYVMLLKKGTVVHFRGKLTLTVLAGAVEVLGHVLRRTEAGCGQPRVSAFSPRGSSLLALEAQDLEERSDCKEVAVEAVASVGMQQRETRKVEHSFEEGDCLLLLEAVASPLYNFLNQHLPGELLPAVEATEVLPDKYTNKELQCTFYRANSEDNVKTFVKNGRWEEVVNRIFEQTCEDGPASCTMLCGGKGVGKSTLLRYLVNRSLSRHPRVLCLDFDPGQAEFTVPGCLSAVLVAQPLLGPHYTHLTVPEKSIYLGQVNVSQCPALYLEAANYLVTFCRGKPEFRGIPWIVNTMGFCKGLGVELTSTLIQMVSPTDLVQIQSQSKQRNFPKELQPSSVAGYRSPFRYIARSSLTVDYRFHPVRSSAESRNRGQDAEWGFDARKLRDIVVLSYLSQLVKPPAYSLTEIVPYMTSLSRLKLRICHETVNPSNVLSVLNGCLVALCCTDNEVFLKPSDPDLPCVFQQTPVCDCLGFGIVRGVDMETKKLFLVTPVGQQLKRVNCLVMGAVQLPACVVLNPVGAVGHVPYVTVGPGQPTGRSSRKSFARLMLAGAV